MSQKSEWKSPMMGIWQQRFRKMSLKVEKSAGNNENVSSAPKETLFNTNGHEVQKFIFEVFECSPKIRYLFRTMPYLPYSCLQRSSYHRQNLSNLLFKEWFWFEKLKRKIMSVQPGGNISSNLWLKNKKLKRIVLKHIWFCVCYDLWKI